MPFQKPLVYDWPVLALVVEDVEDVNRGGPMKMGRTLFTAWVSKRFVSGVSTVGMGIYRWKSPLPPTWYTETEVGPDMGIG